MKNSSTTNNPNQSTVPGITAWARPAFTFGSGGGDATAGTARFVGVVTEPA